MKKTKAALLTAVMVLAIAGCGAKNEETPTDMETETPVIVETVPETATNSEPGIALPNDEWDSLLAVYSDIARNYENAKSLMDGGAIKESSAEAKAVELAGDLVEYGKTCKRESITSEEAAILQQSMESARAELFSILKSYDVEILYKPEDAADDSLAETNKTVTAAESETEEEKAETEETAEEDTEEQTETTEEEPAEEVAD